MIDAAELTSNRINDPLAGHYTRRFDSNYTQYLKFALLRQHVAPGDVCLDVGIANGVLAVPLAPLVREIHGVDISDAMLQACGRHLEEAGVTNVRLYKRSATDLGFPDASFDLVFSYSTLLLIPRPERAVAEAARVLRPGGIAILDVTGRYNLSAVYWGRYYRRQGHFGINAFSYGGITRLFASAGLEVEAAHASGLLDQWKYVPLLRKVSAIDRLVHRTPHAPDLDYRVSQRCAHLANRWYFVLRKAT